MLTGEAGGLAGWQAAWWVGCLTAKGQSRGDNWTCLTSRKTGLSYYKIISSLTRTLVCLLGSRMGSQGTAKATKIKTVWQVACPGTTSFMKSAARAHSRVVHCFACARHRRPKSAAFCSSVVSINFSLRACYAWLHIIIIIIYIYIYIYI